MDSYVIETKNLTKRYSAQESLSDLNLHVKPGRIYGLLGRNGAGKTTAMKLMLGLTRPTRGEVLLWEEPLPGHERALLPRVGSLIEAPGFYPNLTAGENLRLFAALRGRKEPEAVRRALEFVGLPQGDKKLFSQFSLGMKQRLAIALAVMHEPELLILDEPVNGLDPIGIAEIREYIRRLCREKGKTILISSHILSEIALLADDIGVLHHGRLLEEDSLAALEAANGGSIHFTVSDAVRAARILECDFRERQVSVQDSQNLLVRCPQAQAGPLVTALVTQGLEVSEVHTREGSLEEHFKQIIGGEDIA